MERDQLPALFPPCSPFAAPSDFSPLEDEEYQIFDSDEIAAACAVFVEDLIPAPKSPDVPPLRDFIADALWRTRLPHAIVFSALVLLRRFQRYWPGAAGCSTSPHRLFLAAYMLSAKLLQDNSFSNASWHIVSGKLFTLAEIGLMEREMSKYLGWNLAVPRSDLDALLLEYIHPFLREHATSSSAYLPDNIDYLYRSPSPQRSASGSATPPSSLMYSSESSESSVSPPQSTKSSPIWNYSLFPCVQHHEDTVTVPRETDLDGSPEHFQTPSPEPWSASARAAATSSPDETDLVAPPLTIAKAKNRDRTRRKEQKKEVRLSFALAKAKKVLEARCPWDDSDQDRGAAGSVEIVR